MVDGGLGETVVWTAHKLYLLLGVTVGFAPGGVLVYATVTGAEVGPTSSAGTVAFGAIAVVFGALGAVALLALVGVVDSDHTDWYRRVVRQNR